MFRGIREGIKNIKAKPGSSAYLKEFLTIIDNDIGLKIYKLSAAEYFALLTIAEKMAKNGCAGFLQHGTFEFLQRHGYNVCLCEIGYIVSEPEAI